MKYLITLIICCNSFTFIYGSYDSNYKWETENNIILFYKNNSADSLVILNEGDNKIKSKVDNDTSNLNQEIKPQNIMSNPDNVTAPKWYEMITNLPGDMVSFYHQDITLTKIPVYIGITALTAGFILTDELTWKASDKFYNQSQVHKNISDLFVDFGDGSSQFGIAGAFAIYGIIAKDNRALWTASEVVEAVLASGAVVQLLKHITGRQSPFVSTKAGGLWRFFPNQIDYHKHVPSYDAFPSGHLTTSLAAFVVIAENYPEAKWIKPVAYSLSAAIAVCMVNQGIHWYSDYPLAIFLGYEFGEIISHKNSPDNSVNNKKSQLSFSPFFSHLGSGVQFLYSF